VLTNHYVPCKVNIGIMYPKNDLLELISFGESVNLEFKESLSKELRKEIKYSICAFANTLGGKILVDVTDKLHKIIEERRLEISSDWSKELGDGLGDGLGDTQVKILFLILLDKNISIITLAKKIKISANAIEKNINTLKEKGLIKRVGSARSGHWEIVK